MNPGTIRKPKTPADPAIGRGKRVDIRDIIHVCRVRSRGTMLLQAIATKEFQYRVSQVVIGVDGIPRPETKTLKDEELREVLREVVAKQERGATSARLDELVQRLVDRCWNAPDLYCNRKTGEITT